MDYYSSWYPSINIYSHLHFMRVRDRRCASSLTEYNSNLTHRL